MSIKHKIQLKEEIQEDFVRYVNNEFNRRGMERETLTNQWYLNHKFISGSQYFVIDNSTGKIVEASLDEDSPKVSFDILSTIMETRASFINTNKPEIVITTDPKKKSKDKMAKLSNILYNQHFTLEVEPIYDTIVQTVEQDANVFLMSHWMKDITFEDDKEKEKNVVKNTLISPLEIYPMSINDENIKTTQSVMYVKAYSKEYIKLVYPELDDVISYGKKDSMSNQLTSSTSINTIDDKSNIQTDSSGDTSTKEGASKNNFVNFIHYFERSTKKYPKGRFALVVQDSLLQYKEELPVKIDGRYDIPIIQLKQNNTSSSFFTKGVFERAIPLQVKYNMLNNDAEILRQSTMIGNLVLNPDTLVDSTQLTGLSGGEIIGVDPSKPGYVMPTFLQNDISALSVIESQLQQTLNSLVQVTGVNPLAVTGSASGVRSGSQMAMGIEQNESRFAVTVKAITEFYKQHAKLVLSLLKENGNKSTWKEFEVGDEIIGLQEWNANDIVTKNINIGNLPAMLMSDSQKLQAQTKLAQIGAYNKDAVNNFDPILLAKLFKSAGESDVSIPVSKESVDLDYVERIKDKLVDSENKKDIPKLKLGINIELHAKELNKWHLTEEYEVLVETNEHLEKVFALYMIQVTNKMKKEQQEKQAQQMQAQQMQQAQPK